MIIVGKYWDNGRGHAGNGRTLIYSKPQQAFDKSLEKTTKSAAATAGTTTTHGYSVIER